MLLLVECNVKVWPTNWLGFMFGKSFQSYSLSVSIIKDTGLATSSCFLCGSKVKFHLMACTNKSASCYPMTKVTSTLVYSIGCVDFVYHPSNKTELLPFIILGLLLKHIGLFSEIKGFLNKVNFHKSSKKKAKKDKKIRHCIK